MKALEDDPDVPLFFGRLDYGGGAGGSLGLPGEQFYIGRRHVTDENGEPLVVDWRAPVSRPFYRASRTDPMGVRLRTAVRVPPRRGDGVRGRAPRRATARPRPAERPPQRDPRGRDRASAGGADARHRRDHPARAGRHRPRRPRHERLRARRAGHRQDRRRAAPGGVPAVRAPRPAQPAGRAGGRPERLVPALHRRRAAGARRDRRPADHGRGARRARAARGGRPRRGGAAQGRRPDGDGPRQRALVADRSPPPRVSSYRSGARRWRVPAYEADEIVAELRQRERPVRRRAGDAAPTAGARDLGQDGAGRRLSGRPGAELGGPQQTGQAARRRAVARGRRRGGW